MAGSHGCLITVSFLDQQTHFLILSYVESLSCKVAQSEATTRGIDHGCTWWEHKWIVVCEDYVKTGGADVHLKVLECKQQQQSFLLSDWVTKLTIIKFLWEIINLMICAICNLPRSHSAKFSVREPSENFLNTCPSNLMCSSHVEVDTICGWGVAHSEEVQVAHISGLA